MSHLAMLNPYHIDGYLEVKDEVAIEMAGSVAKVEGIFGGFSSGANIAAAMHLFQGSFKGKTVGVLINDSGLKYLSTDLWESDRF